MGVDGHVSTPMQPQRWPREFPSHRPTSTTGAPGRTRCPTTRARCSPTAPIAAPISAGRCAPRAEHRASSPPAYGAATNGNVRPPQCLESADPPRARPDREDLRRLQTLLRPAPNAMARPRQSRRPGPPHRPKMNPVRHPQDPEIGSLRGIMIKTMYFRGLHCSATCSARSRERPG